MKEMPPLVQQPLDQLEATALPFDRATEARRFLAHIFSGVPGGLVELRCIARNLPIHDRDRVRQAFFDPADHTGILDFAFAAAVSHDAYTGIATRRARSGAKESCLWVPALWAEIDYKDFASPDDAMARLEAFRIRPSMVVSSGGGLHAYWRLVRPAPAQPVDQIEGRLRPLCRAVGGDPGATDVGRVLRLPGTWNHKPERRAPDGSPPLVHIVRCDG